MRNICVCYCVMFFLVCAYGGCVDNVGVDFEYDHFSVLARRG